MPTDSPKVQHTYVNLWMKVEDPEVRRIIEEIFRQFLILGSIGKVVTWLRKNHFKLPSWHRTKHIWSLPCRRRVHQILTHPAYAGYYVLRVSPLRKNRGTGLDLVESPDAIVTPDHHDPYVDKETWLRIQHKLADNRLSVRQPVCKGKALCQGLVWCGTCGVARMAVDYPKLAHGRTIRYKCSPRNKQYGGVHSCLSVAGEPLDALVTSKVLASVAPAPLAAVIAATEERRQGYETVLRQREAELERARYAARILKQRYDQIDPANRLVAVEVEKDLNAALQGVREVEHRHKDVEPVPPLEPTPAVVDAIRGLTEDLPALWAAPSTTYEDRKTILNLLVEKIHATKIDPTHVRIDIKWRGAAPTSDVLASPRAGAVLARDLFFNERIRPQQIAVELNRQGFRTVEGHEPYTAGAVRKILHAEFKKTGGRPWAAFREALRPIIQPLVDCGMSDGAIARDLNAQGIKPHNAAAWARDGIQALRRRLGIQSNYVGRPANPRTPPKPRSLIWDASIETLRASLQPLVDRGMRDQVIAEALNARSITSPNHAPWNRESVRYLRKKLGIPRPACVLPRRPRGSVVHTSKSPSPQPATDERA